VPPSRVNAKVPRDLETICLKSMAKDPQRRYRSALALAQDLERFQAGESIVARREGTFARIWRRVRRRPITITLFGLVIALAVGANVFLYQRTAFINSLKGELDAGMEVQPWTASHLLEMEDLVEKLKRYDPDEAALRLQRLHRRCAQSIRSSIQQDSISEVGELRRIQNVINELANQDPTLAEILRQDLNDRLKKVRKGPG